MSDSPQDFEKLRQLMQLKRYEQPPPGYFDRLPSQIISRLQTGEARGKTDLLSADAPWARRLVRMLETNPLFAGAFGAAVCALLVFGATSFQYAEQASVASVGDNALSANLSLANNANVQTASSMNPSLNVSSVVPGTATFGSLNIGPGQPAGVEQVLYNPGK